MLERYKINNYKPAKNFISFKIANSLMNYNDIFEKSIVTQYQPALGAFMQLAIYFSPDLALYSVKIFSYFYSNHGLVYVESVKHVLQYVSGILELGLTFDKKVNILDDLIRYINSKFVE